MTDEEIGNVAFKLCLMIDALVMAAGFGVACDNAGGDLSDYLEDYIKYRRQDGASYRPSLQKRREFFERFREYVAELDQELSGAIGKERR